MGRKCSHCGNIGHNSRTCTANKGAASASASAATAAVGGGLRLFGVHLDVSSYSSSSLSSPAISMKKSSSMDCLSSSSSPSSSLSSTLLSIDEDKTSIGYLSDGLMVGRTQQEKKKGVPWTEEEHRRFLMGLEKLGKGDWRGISKNFVITRTPTQVASHAQKYFLRQASLNKKKRRSSLFDLVGSRTTMAGHHVNNCGSKPSNLHLLLLPAQDPKPENGSRHEKIMPLVDLISSETHESAASSSSSSQQQQQQHHQVVPIWVHESKLHPNPSNNIASKPSSQLNAAAAAADHDLELTLATPTTIRSPITVT